MSFIFIPRAYTWRMGSDGNYERDWQGNMYVPIDAIRDFGADATGTVTRVNEYHFAPILSGELKANDPRKLKADGTIHQQTAVVGHHGYIDAKLLRDAMTNPDAERQAKARELIWEQCVEKGAH